MVNDRMLKRIVLFTFVPVFTGFALYPFFYWLKVRFVTRRVTCTVNITQVNSCPQSSAVLPALMCLFTMPSGGCTKSLNHPRSSRASTSQYGLFI